jgi:hypothetical protein
MRPLAVLLPALLALTACGGRHPTGPLQQWTDENGNVRYTTSPDQVPRGDRDTLARVEPGRSAGENAAELPGSRTEPLTPPSAAEWLKGESPDPAPAGLEPAPEPEEALEPTPVASPAPITPPLDAAALDQRILALKSQIAETEVQLADATAADPPADADQLRQISSHLEELQMELDTAQKQRAALPPSDGR